MTQSRLGADSLAIVIASLALVAAACGGSVGEYVQPDMPEQPTTTERDRTTSTLIAPQANPAEGAESTTTTTEADESSESNAGSAGGGPELPGAGANLAQTALGVDHWQFFPPKAWNLIDGEGTDKQTFSTAKGMSTVETLAPTITEGEALIAELTAATNAEFDEVKVYDSGSYFHKTGYEVVWVRFDIVTDGIWQSAQRFWMVSEKSTLQITVVVDDPEAFEDELFAVQGMVNEIECPE